MKLVTVLYFVSSIFVSAINETTAQGSNLLFCHSCSPLADGTNCNEVTSDTLATCTNWDGHDVSVNCFAAFLDYDNAQLPDIGWDRTTRNPSTGVYRGCAETHSAVPDFCAFYREQVAPANISVVSCVTCEEHACNSHLFNPNGQIASGENLQLVHSLLPFVSFLSLLRVLFH